MPIVKKLRKLCRRCDNLFVANGQYATICNKCIDSSKKLRLNNKRVVTRK